MAGRSVRVQEGLRGGGGGQRGRAFGLKAAGGRRRTAAVRAHGPLVRWEGEGLVEGRARPGAALASGRTSRVGVPSLGLGADPDRGWAGSCPPLGADWADGDVSLKRADRG